MILTRLTTQDLPLRFGPTTTRRCCGKRPPPGISSFSPFCSSSFPFPGESGHEDDGRVAFWLVPSTRLSSLFSLLFPSFF
jgi:hypothetical protein